MATSLTNLGVQYMPSTGGCMVDLAAIPPGMFDSCKAIHVKLPEEQHQIDVHSNMICIQPSKSVSAPYREQYLYPDASPPPLATNSPKERPKEQVQEKPPPPKPESPTERPQPANNGGNEDDGGPNNPERSNMPAEHPEAPSPTIQTYVRPAQSTLLTTCTSMATHSQVTYILQSSILVHSPTSFSTITSHLSRVSNTPVTHFSTISSPPSTITITPTPTPLPERPATPPPAPADPEPLPSYCGSSYVKMDMTTIETMDTHDFDVYLDLLGLGSLGLDLEHGISGLIDSLLGTDSNPDSEHTRTVHQELEHSYRVLCSVDDPNLDFSVERAERVATTDSQNLCLEECEKDAVAKARDGEVKDCLGAAWHRSLEHDNCRFWTGEDELLPVERMMGEKGGEWDLVYL
ncbi:uncharacterized protein F4822DRAFT_440156 [Hypoxylon trugodes]|uniref:uncharacterized protein n=1 Tax=Hypoxylon trugodes TaxID=326681 RepID=UPI00219E73EC|nr:uncharacterized protein F4822DRAFT_440156 [Hypoxylon trugodes]KAI1383902.1 hypothetical protein F4822DRAFT_440156 [Hypoxylon trugodes]